MGHATCLERASPLRRPVAAARRGLDRDGLAGLQHGFVRALQIVHAPVQAAYIGRAELARLAAEQAEGPNPAMARQDRAGQPLQEPDGPERAVAGLPLALPARAPAHVKILKEHRE